MRGRFRAFRNVAGDRVLVHKHYFDHRPPRRWEIAMFRNPGRPTENYVKRSSGFPAKRFKSVTATSTSMAKSSESRIAQQRQMRIPVFDNDYQPPASDADWQPRWRPQSCGQPIGRSTGTAFAISHQAIRDGNERSTGLDRLPALDSRRGSADDDRAALPMAAGKRSPQSLLQQRDLRQRQTNPHMPRHHVHRRPRTFGGAEPGFLVSNRRSTGLYEQSHIAADYRWIRLQPPTAGAGQPVRDLMVALRLAYGGGSGEFTLRMTDGH